MDRNEVVKGDSIIVIGNQETKLKYAFFTVFTNTTFPTEESISNTQLLPRFLIGTSGCIGAALDCSHHTYNNSMTDNQQ